MIAQQLGERPPIVDVDLTRDAVHGHADCRAGGAARGRAGSLRGDCRPRRDDAHGGQRGSGSFEKFPARDSTLAHGDLTVVRVGNPRPLDETSGL
ncbi:MAG: hypothetical protein DMG00_23520 [Acidobacteria bacterium]|nr:MAG: hypothetical protein DMG00_23520 [Acidobacteriota bacterium]